MKEKQRKYIQDLASKHLANTQALTMSVLGLRNTKTEVYSDFDLHNAYFQGYNRALEDFKKEET